MRRLLTWVLVTLGIAEIARRLRRRAQQDEIAPAAGEDDDPAGELRRKLAESRSEEEAAVAEPPTSPEASVEQRRANVHEEGRATLGEMREPDES
jgi:hypothetical protein